MPIEYTVSSDGVIVHAVASGAVTLDEVRRYMHDVARDERIRPGFSELFDGCQITEGRVGPESFAEIQELVLADPKRKPGSRVAIVVGKRPSFDKAKQYERLAGSTAQNVIVFNDMHTAKIWLGAVDARAEPIEQGRG